MVLYIKENSSTLHGSAEEKQMNSALILGKHAMQLCQKQFSSCFLPADVSIVSDLDALVQLFFSSPLCGCVLPVQVGRRLLRAAVCVRGARGQGHHAPSVTVQPVPPAPDSVPAAPASAVLCAPSQSESTLDVFCLNQSYISYFSNQTELNFLPSLHLCQLSSCGPEVIFQSLSPAEIQLYQLYFYPFLN